MPKMVECVITVETAIRLRDTIKSAGEKLGRPFICPVCKHSVKPLVQGGAMGSHFEHFKRNVGCPLSDNRKAKKLYADYRKAKKIGD
jgi:competence CoiA-like predicted nuclease